MTLVDTSQISMDRDSRAWSKVYDNLQKTSVYPGSKELIQELHSNNFRLGIVTSSPRKYAEKICKYHGIDLEIICAYHDTKTHKPNPEPLRLACERLGLEPHLVAYVGDQNDDMVAANSIGLYSILASWSNELIQINQAKFRCQNFQQLRELFFPHIPTSLHKMIIDGENEVTGFYLSHYFPSSRGVQDNLSKRLLEFKDNQKDSVQRFTNISISKLKSKIDNLDIIIRALGSSEIKATANTSLDFLCSGIASSYGCTYSPESLWKTRTTDQLKDLGRRSKRLEEINGVYSFHTEEPASDISLKVLLVDDVSTTGSTVQEISRAIRAEKPHAQIYFFSLSKTSSRTNETIFFNSRILREMNEESEEKSQEPLFPAKKARPKSDSSSDTPTLSLFDPQAQKGLKFSPQNSEKIRKKKNLKTAALKKPNNVTTRSKGIKQIKKVKKVEKPKIAMAVKNIEHNDSSSGNMPTPQLNSRSITSPLNKKPEIEISAKPLLDIDRSAETIYPIQDEIPVDAFETSIPNIKKDSGNENAKTLQIIEHPKINTAKRNERYFWSIFLILIMLIISSYFTHNSISSRDPKKGDRSPNLFANQQSEKTMKSQGAISQDAYYTNSDGIKYIQFILAEALLYPGNIDGNYGSQTRRALNKIESYFRIPKSTEYMNYYSADYLNKVYNDDSKWLTLLNIHLPITTTIQQECNLLEASSPISKVKMILPKNRIIEILEYEDYYCRIKTVQLDYGYVNKQWIANDVRAKIESFASKRRPDGRRLPSNN